MFMVNRSLINYPTKQVGSRMAYLASYYSCKNIKVEQKHRQNAQFYLQIYHLEHIYQLISCLFTLRSYIPFSLPLAEAICTAKGRKINQTNKKTLKKSSHTHPFQQTRKDHRQKIIEDSCKSTWSLWSFI